MNSYTPHLNRRAFLLTSIATVAACAPRGELTSIRPDQSGTDVDLLVATNREPAENGIGFSSTRSPKTHFAGFRVSVPEDHKIGQVELPRRRHDPRKHFSIVSGDTFSSERAFANEIANRVQRLPLERREAILYIHGYNVTFSESLFRLGQLVHDFEINGVPLLFSWPSEGEGSGYLYDRDSALIARDTLEALLDVLNRSQVQRIQIIAHSMGSHLLMETLRQRAIRNNGRLWSKLEGIVLVAPDIDIDLFTKQTKEIGNLPQPFIIMASDQDRALLLSEFVSGSRARLGLIASDPALAALPVTVIDTSEHAERFGANHDTALSSPAIISLIRGIQNSQIAEDSLPAGRVALPAWLSGTQQ